MSKTYNKNPFRFEVEGRYAPKKAYNRQRSREMFLQELDMPFIEDHGLRYEAQLY